MAYCRIESIVVIFSVVHCIASVQVPVFLWGDLLQVSQKFNPLTKVTFPEFFLLLKHELQKDPFTVIFIEETLSVEDFSLKNSNGETSFPYLHSIIGNALYVPSVENPLSVLNKLANPENVNHIQLTENGLSADIVPKSGKYLFINLNDALEGESRSDLLRRHNDFMQSPLKNLSAKYDSIVSIYTAHYPSWTVSMSRMKRQTRSRTDILDLPGLRISFEQLLYSDGYKEHVLSFPSPGITKFVNPYTQHSTMLYGKSINVTMFFVLKKGYWYWDTIYLYAYDYATEMWLDPITEYYSPANHSFRCGQNTTFTHTNPLTGLKRSLIFQDVKVQPYFYAPRGVPRWGESWNCVGFFSGPIWMGLFVVFILLLILFYGIMMVMDIKPNDRFDDPNGKSITDYTVD